VKEDSLKKRYIIKLFTNIISGVIGAILVAIVPKALGPIAYGQFVYLQDFFAKAIGFLDMGTSIAFFTKLSADNKRKELMTFYFLYALIILIVMLLFIVSIDIFDYTDTLLPNIPNAFVYFGFFLGFFSWVSQLLMKISDAYALTVSVELIKITHKVLSLFLLLFLIYNTSFGLEKYFYFNYFVFISLFVILSWLFIKKGIFSHIFKFNFSISHLSKEFIDYCHPLLAYSILGLIAGFFDIWLLQKIGGSEQTGFYGLAYALATMCFLFTSAMTPIITREFSKSYAQNNLKEMRRLFYRYIPMLYSIAGFFSVFVSMQSENILQIFTDEQFKDAYVVLVVMAYYPIHQTYGQLSGSIFYATGQTKLMRNISFFTMPLGALFTLWLIYFLKLDALGLAIKMVAIQLIGVNIQLYFNAKILKLDIKHFISHQFYSILFFIILSYISNELIEVSSSLLSFIYSGILYTCLVIIFTYIFPQVFATTREEIKEFSLRIMGVIKK